MREISLHSNSICAWFERIKSEINIEHWSFRSQSFHKQKALKSLDFLSVAQSLSVVSIASLGTWVTCGTSHFDNYISMLNHLKCSSCFNGFSQPDDGEGPSKHVCFPIARAHSLSYDLWQKNFHLSVSRVIAKSRTLKLLKFNHRREVWWVVLAALLLAFALIDLCSRHWRTHPPKKTAARADRIIKWLCWDFDNYQRRSLLSWAPRKTRPAQVLALNCNIYFYYTFQTVPSPQSHLVPRDNQKPLSACRIVIFYASTLAKGGVIQTSSVIRGISRCSFWICTVHRDEIK